MSLIARILLFIAGPIAALIVARDAVNFSVMQTFVAAILMAVFVGLIAFWPKRRRGN